MKSRLILVFILFLYQATCAWSSDTDYNSCVRNNLEKAKSGQAAIIIKNTCKERFGKKPKASKKDKVYSCTPKSNNDYCKFLIDTEKAVQELW